MDTTQKINTVEWFFGYGGNHIGLKRVIPNLCLRAVCEIEEYAIENILAKMESGLLEAAPIWSNCKTFPTKPFVDRVDLFIASYPCQPFSSAGKRQGENDERHLWPSVYMWIRATRPLCVFLENVEGHVSMGLSTVISDLEEAGYETSWGIFSARECLDGNNETATHQRKRVFIMAHLKNNGLEVNNRSKIQCETSGRWTLQPWGIRPCDALWPSRPGQQQHAWEPPRVTNGKLADTYSSEQSEKRGDNGEMPKVSSEQWADQCSTISGREGEFSGEEVLGNADNLQCTRSGELGDIQRSILPQDGWQETSDGLVASSEGMGNSNNNVEFDVSRKQYGKAEQPITSDSSCLGNASECNEIKPEVGGDANGSAIGLDLPGMSTISDSELVEIFDWMVKGESRVDELRLLGNGVFPSTAEKAFRVLFKELIER